MKSKHTPGPWKSNWDHQLNNGPKLGWDVAGEDYQCNGPVCTLPDGHVDGPEVTEANAHLIAAAPELLEAARTIYSLLIDAQSFTGQESIEIKNLGKALDKAEQ